MSDTASHKRRILVVDDEPLVCDALRLMLQYDGHHVEIAHSGPEALARFKPGEFDIVITDFSMAAMKGDELATTIKARSPKQPVIMITAYAEVIQSTAQDLSAVNAVLSKPFQIENLREAIAKAAP